MYNYVINCGTTASNLEPIAAGPSTQECVALCVQQLGAYEFQEVVYSPCDGDGSTDHIVWENDALKKARTEERTKCWLRAIAESDAFGEAFMSVIDAAMYDDDGEPFESKGRAVAKALANNDASELLLALTGWYPSTLAMMANIIPNTDQYSLSSRWVVNIQTKTGEWVQGEVAPATFEVFAPEGIIPAVVKYHDIDRKVIPKSKRRIGDQMSFWYDDTKGENDEK